jgi:hypothetical protein
MKKDASDRVQRVLSENVITLREAAIEIQAATGIKPDKSSLTRWILRGVGGCKLDAVRIGRQWVTSSQSITRFIAERSV